MRADSTQPARGPIAHGREDRHGSRGVSESGLRVFRLPSNPVSFGVVSDFIAHYPPFDMYEFGLMVKTIRYQLEQQTHCVGAVGNNLVAYVGWILTTQEIAEAWTHNRGPLHPNAASGDAVAVTVLAARAGGYILPLIKEAKKLNLNNSVFWKRSFADGRADHKRAVRKRAP